MKGHTRRRGKTWAFVIDIGTDPATGRRRQKWVSGFERERDAAKAMRDYIARIERGEVVAEANETVASYLRDQWLPSRRSKVKESTWAGYQDAVEGRIIPAIGALPLRKVTPKHIAKLYDDLLIAGSRDTRRGRGLAPKTVRNTGLVLKKALGDAVRLGLLARNPTEHVEMPRVERKEMKTWTTAQARQFIGFIRGDRLEALWILMLTSGMRRGELIGLKWADVDLDAGRLAVRRARVAVGYKVVWSSPKTMKSARVIALDVATCDVLQAHRAGQGDEMALVGDAYHDEDLVFAKPDGSPLHPDYVSQRFGRLVKKAGLPIIRLHDTRHTAATLLLEAGIPVKVVSERFGHSTTSITADLYQHVAPHMQEEAANKLGAMLLGEPEPEAEDS
ncbi:MAG: site-specific integrase [Actinobacteria bacterium]|nr:MAG: site-specific integrase [Actinomycetota bacterium]RIK06317.1 MAG: site-specific integrase [Acidobacteriota bacterium]